MAQPKWRKRPAKKLSKSQRRKIAQRNKRAGSNHEREEVNRYGRYFHNVASTRSCNQHRDGCGIDICNQDEATFGRLPIEVSCKTSVSSIPFQKLLHEMDGEGIRVVHFKKTQKSKEGVFIAKGEYAIMYREGYEQFLQHVYVIQVLRNTHPELIHALEKKFDLQLLNVPQQVHLQKPVYDSNTTDDGPTE